MRTPPPEVVIAVDPGLLSGFAVVARGTGTAQRARVLAPDPHHGVLLPPLPEGHDEDALVLVAAGELDWVATGECVRDWLALSGMLRVDVVAERFTITVKTATNSQAPWSLKVLGMLDWIAYQHSLDVGLQNPSDAKSLVPNEILRDCGLWYRGGKGHALDALRHAVYRYARTGWRDVWKKS